MDAALAAQFAIAHVIQLALAPVFLLSGIGIFLTVLTNRPPHRAEREPTVNWGVISTAGTGPGSLESRNAREMGDDPVHG